MTSRGSNYDYDDLIASGRGELSGPGNAQLPLPPMLLFERITNVSASGGKYGRGEMEAELGVTRDLWFFQGNFGGDPVMPGCLGLDAMWQMLGFFLWWSGGLGHGRALGVGSLKLFGQVLPDAGRVTYHIDVKRIIRSKLVLGVADGSLSVDGEVICSAQSLKVGLFRQVNV